MLTALLASDSVCILMTFTLFSLPKMVSVSPYIIPVSLPVAQVRTELQAGPLSLVELRRGFALNGWDHGVAMPAYAIKTQLKAPKAPFF